jgi:hypothetical protein
MSEVTTRLAPLDAPSYRARVCLGDYDWNHPEAFTQVIGLKAATPDLALKAVRHLIGPERLILEIWRQDGSFRSKLFNDGGYVETPIIFYYASGESAYLSGGNERRFWPVAVENTDADLNWIAA